MKKITLILGALLVMVVPFFVFAPGVRAGDFRSGDNAVVGSKEVVDHSLFISGNNVEVNGEIHGDVFCAGQNVTVNAKVSGDVLCAGMNVWVGGTVDGDVRLAGQLVSLSAHVAHNASLAGSMVSIEPDSVIGGDVQAAGSNLTMKGEVERDVEAAGNTVTLNSMVGRDVQVTSDNILLGGGTKITGNVTYYSHNKLRQATGALVNGTLTQKEPEQHQNRTDNPFAAAFAGRIMFFLMFIVLTMVVAALFPRMVHSVSDNAVTKLGMTLLIGLAACIGVPILIIISLFTIIGALLGLVLLLFWIVVMLLAGVFTSYYVGRLVFMRAPQHPLLMMFVGSLIIVILMFIPIINILTWIAMMLLGSGMAVRELFTRAPKPAYEQAIAEPAKASKKSK